MFLLSPSPPSAPGIPGRLSKSRTGWGKHLSPLLCGGTGSARKRIGKSEYQKAREVTSVALHLRGLTTRQGARLARFPIYLASLVLPVQRCGLLTLKLSKASQGSRNKATKERKRDDARRSLHTLPFRLLCGALRKPVAYRSVCTGRTASVLCLYTRPTQCPSTVINPAFLPGAAGPMGIFHLVVE